MFGFFVQLIHRLRRTKKQLYKNNIAYLDFLSTLFVNQ